MLKLAFVVASSLLACGGSEATPDAEIPDAMSMEPTVVDDSYLAYDAGFFNSRIGARTLIRNDDNVDSVVEEIITTTLGGSVAIEADGHFFYTMPTPFDSVDTFNYTAVNSIGTTTGTVAISPLGKVWFVDKSAAPGGDGSYATPFNSLQAFSTLASDEPGDVISLRADSVPYSGPFVVPEDRTLIGQATRIPGVLDSTARPTIKAPGATAIELSSGAGLRGLSIGDSSTGLLCPAGNTESVSVGNVSISDATLSLDIQCPEIDMQINSLGCKPTGTAIAMTTAAGNLGITAPLTGDCKVEISDSSAIISFFHVVLTSATGSISLNDLAGQVSFVDVTISDPDASFTVDNVQNVTIASLTAQSLKILNQPMAGVVNIGNFVADSVEQNAIDLSGNGEGLVLINSLSLTGDPISGAQAFGVSIQNNAAGFQFSTNSTDITGLGVGLSVSSDAGTYTFGSTTLDNAAVDLQMSTGSVGFHDFTSQGRFTSHQGPSVVFTGNKPSLTITEVGTLAGVTVDSTEASLNGTSGWHFGALTIRDTDGGGSNGIVINNLAVPFSAESLTLDQLADAIVIASPTTDISLGDLSIGQSQATTRGLVVSSSDGSTISINSIAATTIDNAMDVRGALTLGITAVTNTLAASAGYAGYFVDITIDGGSMTFQNATSGSMVPAVFEQNVTGTINY